MPIKDRVISEPALERKLPPPAPYMLNGLCSDCAIEPVFAGDGDLKICPKCHGLLWHRDYVIARAQELAARREFERVRLHELRRVKLEQKLRAKLGAKLGRHFDGRDHRWF